MVTKHHQLKGNHVTITKTAYQGPAATCGSISAHPITGASTTNASTIACVWKGCAAMPSSTGTAGSHGGRGAAWSPRRPTATRDPSSMSSCPTQGASPPAWGLRAEGLQKWAICL
uniref:Uncharacterized protein n=1 Tax=Rhinolophus ferrumequinum TaxID=59479 RepID=A0A671FJE2_RHIFE